MARRAAVDPRPPEAGHVDSHSERARVGHSGRGGADACVEGCRRYPDRRHEPGGSSDRLDGSEGERAPRQALRVGRMPCRVGRLHFGRAARRRLSDRAAGHGPPPRSRPTSSPDRRFVMLYDRTTLGQIGHVIMEINGEFFQSGGQQGSWGGGRRGQDLDSKRSLPRHVQPDPASGRALTAAGRWTGQWDTLRLSRARRHSTVCESSATGIRSRPRPAPRAHVRARCPG